MTLRNPQLTTYLQETLGLELRLEAYADAKGWPLAFRGAYDVCGMELMEQPFLLVCPKESGVSPATMEKQMAWMQRQSGRVCIVLMEAVTPYQRKRFLERKVPFVVPGNQLYLPDLGLDLREHLRQVRPQPETFSPSTQLVVLMHCLRGTAETRYTASGLARQLGYTKMTMSRALHELAAVNLLEHIRKGRLAQARFVRNGRELWEQAGPYLQSPVQQRCYFAGKGETPGLIAGESALAKQSMLSDPKRLVRAVTASTGRNWQQNGNRMQVPETDAVSADLELELWSYDPEILGTDGTVDPLSLILSLRNTDNERIEGELRDLEEGLTWS